jgi:hypothetical protein
MKRIVRGVGAHPTGFAAGQREYAWVNNYCHPADNRLLIPLSLFRNTAGGGATNSTHTVRVLPYTTYISRNFINSETPLFTTENTSSASRDT